MSTAPLVLVAIDYLERLLGRRPDQIAEPLQFGDLHVQLGADALDPVPLLREHQREQSISE